jgi:CRISPR/Cas system-associated exonuclease Cas4 (RecB family)
VEEELRGQLVLGVPDLLARIDLLVETDDALVLTDLKTARNSWSDDQVTRSTGQLLLYSELVKRIAGGKPVRLAFAVLTKGKFPDLTTYPVLADPGQVERMKGVVQRVWQAIEAGIVYPAPSPMQCPSCPYRDPCAAWRG